MKPFDLAKAKAGEPLVTRNGRAVSEFYHFLTSTDRYPCVAIIDGVRFSLTTDGCEYKDSGESPRDLFMAPKKRTVYVNFYRDRKGSHGQLAVWHQTQDGAIENGSESEALAIAVPIEIEE
jgi:hypothetical protein